MLWLLSCHRKVTDVPQIMVLGNLVDTDTSKIWLTHEHILVDFIGADRIDKRTWNEDSVMRVMMPYLNEVAAHGVEYFVDATPHYLGRDVSLLQRIADSTGLTILTNTGLYGAGNNKYIPAFAERATAEELAALWIDEFRSGIDGTKIKPGFIKIGVNNSDPLKPMDQKLVKAAALTHLATGLTIASHTGAATGLWPQLEILRKAGVSPSAFIWVHAQGENDYANFLSAAKAGCWISLDGLGWETDTHIDKLLFAKENAFLDRVLISHDAGWFDPQKQEQSIQPYSNIFERVIPTLRAKGFTVGEIDGLMKRNPARAFGLRVRSHTLND